MAGESDIRTAITILTAEGTRRSDAPTMSDERRAEQMGKVKRRFAVTRGQWNEAIAAAGAALAEDERAETRCPTARRGPRRALPGSVVIRAWEREMDRRIAAMREDPVAYIDEARRQARGPGLLAWVQTVTAWACTWALERAGVR